MAVTPNETVGVEPSSIARKHIRFYDFTEDLTIADSYVNLVSTDFKKSGSAT